MPENGRMKARPALQTGFGSVGATASAIRVFRSGKEGQAASVAAAASAAAAVASRSAAAAHDAAVRTMLVYLRKTQPAHFAAQK